MLPHWRCHYVASWWPPTLTHTGEVAALSLKATPSVYTEAVSGAKKPELSAMSKLCMYVLPTKHVFFI